MFERLIEDKKVIDCYKSIEELESEHAPIKHDLSHVLNVVSNVENILSQLGVEKDFIESAKISALLHDIGMIKGKEDHAVNSYIWAAQFFKRHNMILPYHTEVLHAIRDHTDLKNSISLMTRALILADRLDITRTRLTDLGKDKKGYRILNSIKDIELKIEDDSILLDIQTDSNFNLKEIETISNFKELVNALSGFAKHQNLSCSIYVDGNELDLC